LWHLRHIPTKWAQMRMLEEAYTMIRPQPEGVFHSMVPTTSSALMSHVDGSYYRPKWATSGLSSADRTKRHSEAQVTKRFSTSKAQPRLTCVDMRRSSSCMLYVIKDVDHSIFQIYGAFE